jgi:serine protease Do
MAPSRNLLEEIPSTELPQKDGSRRFSFEEALVPRRVGVGSGVILDSKGIILTNSHVVAGADEVLVELSDGSQYEAVKISSDPLSDLAVIWIAADGPVPAARLGDSDRLDVGDWVLAIGSPFGLQQTVSAGIISGLQRSPSSGQRSYFLQTDAAINPGNSGGPLVSLDGAVIGINTAIASGTGGYQGIGFAIPSNHANWVKDQLVENGSVKRGYLGVGTVKNTPQLAEKLGVAPNRGVFVSKVFRDTPAEMAGFLPGDLILAFAGMEVDSPHRLQEVVERSAAGSKQEVGLIRDGKIVSLQVIVSSIPAKVNDFPQPARATQSS